jgi:hypothetical protein
VLALSAMVIFHVAGISSVKYSASLVMLFSSTASSLKTGTTISSAKPPLLGVMHRIVGAAQGRERGFLAKTGTVEKN